jgi:predicted alpha/beta superfamily hydrolase
MLFFFLSLHLVFEIDGKNITLFGALDKPLPIVYLHTFRHEGERVWQQCHRMGIRQFILVEISGLNWDEDMSPWAMNGKPFHEESIIGRAGRWLDVLLTEVIPQVETQVQVSRRYLAGYSLAGLFALWSIYHTDCFDGIVSGSGSFWYPGFMDYIRFHQPVRFPDAIYFSLGDQESKTQKVLYSKVEDNTRWLCEYYQKQNVKTVFQLNNGNHYMQSDWRIAKGIQWILG